MKPFTEQEVWNTAEAEAARMAAEISTLRAELDAVKAQRAALLDAADNINRQLGYFMECDSCANDPHSSWPDTDCEGCSYCSASADIAKYNEVREASEA